MRKSRSMASILVLVRFAIHSISEKDTSLLQSNILKSHSVGVGKPIPQEIAKFMLITKVHALAQGYSGISPQTLERVIWHIDNDVIPVVPEKGSVGASGDLARRLPIYFCR
jgi:histidine ammonia-lyase